jgi:hypothetical protein
MTPHPFEAWLDSHGVPDDAFERAYRTVGERGRAWLKTAMARSFALHPPGPGRLETTVLRHADGAFHARATAARESCAVVVPAGYSPARFLAALVPARTSGVERVLVVVLGARPAAHALLAACELAGQEEVVRLGVNELGTFLDAEGMRSTLLVDLDARAGDRGGPRIRPGRVERLGVFCEPGAGWDFEALAFAQPDVDIEVWNGGALPDSGRFIPRSGSYDDFGKAGPYAAAYVSKPRAESFDVPDSASLVLAPGQEPFWHWEAMAQQNFRLQHRLFWVA